MGNVNYEILEDGKNDWRNKKKDNLIISNSFRRLGISKKIDSFFNISYDMLYCANYLEFKLFDNDTKKLNRAMFCKRRLCPMCNWRRSKKIFGQVSKIVNEIDKTNDYDYIFVTFTCKNVLGNELENQINLLSKSFMNMIRGNKIIRTICKGYFRAIEVTYNKKENMYHPHIHCIIVVNKSYFKSKNYLSTEKWVNIWKYYLKVDYNPIVDVRKVKSNNYKYKAVAEISKYTVKSKDIILFDKKGNVDEKLTDENVFILHFALKNKRLVTYGGIMKELHKKLNLEDLNKDNIDLINTDVVDNDELLNYIILKYKWNVGLSNYKLVL